MSEVEELVKRLQRMSRSPMLAGMYEGKSVLGTLASAASEIESLRASLTRVEEERDEAVKALGPFAELGAGVAKEGDGVWRRRWRGSVTNHGKEPEVIFREYEPFIKAHDVATRLSRASATETERSE